jgi:chromosome segregation ATPase
MTVAEEIKHLGARLVKFSEQIRDLENEIEGADPKLKEDLNAELKAIREQRRHAEDRLGASRVKAADAWADEDFRAGILSVFDEIGRRIDVLFGRVK